MAKEVIEISTLASILPSGMSTIMTTSTHKLFVVANKGGKGFASTEEGLAITNKAQGLYNQYYEKCESFISNLQNKAESSVKQLMGSVNKEFNEVC